MKYDDASWHYGGDFPSDLPDSAGAIHTGMYLAWALLAGLGGELFAEEEPELLKELQERSITPGAFFLKHCDGKFTDEDLDERGNAFTKAYFNLEDSRYLIDYEELLNAGQPTLYHVPDTWQSFDTLSPRLNQRFAEWSAGEG